MKVKNKTKKYVRRAGHLFRPNETKEINVKIDEYKANEIKHCTYLTILDEEVEEVEEVEEDKVICPVCEKEYTSQGITRHINSAHPDYKEE